MPLRRLISVPAFIAVAALVVVAPRVLLIVAAAVAVVALLMWGLGGESPALGAKQGAVTRPDPLPAVWLATLVTLAVFTLDVQGIFTHGDGPGVTPLRYLLLPVPFAVVALAMRRPPELRRFRAADAFLVPLLVWGLGASLAYKVLAGGAISGLSFFLPMILAFFHLVRRGGELSEASARRMLDLLSYIGGAYVLTHLAAGLGVPGIARGAHGHQTAFLLAGAVAAAFTTGRRKLATVELAAIAGIYLLYPAATYVTTAGAVLVTVLLLSPSRTGMRKVVIGVAVPVILVLGFTSSLSDGQDSFANKLLPRYFAALGKSDNSGFRREMLKLGVEQVRSSPVIGSNFTAGFALPTRFRVGRQAVLPHNDYLELALAGGLVALGLFLGWAAATNVHALKRHRLLVEAGADGQARLVWTLLLMFNACLSVALFQPVLFEMGTVTLFFLLYACMRQACDSAAVDEPPAPAPAAKAARHREPSRP